MAELPAHYHAAAAREHITIIGHLPRRRVEHAVRSSLPTMRHAILLADALVTALGDRGWDDPSTIRPSRRIHLRDATDPSWLVPQPLLEIRRIAERREATLATFQMGPDLPTEDQPDDWKRGDPPWYPTPRKPDIAPHGPDMFCGDLILREGPTHYILRYDERGIVSGSSMCGGDLFWAARAPHRMPLAIDASHRPPEARPMTLLCRADLSDEMSATEIATMLLATDQPTRIGVRVWLPVDVPGGAELVPNAALVGLRRALAEGAPPDARVAVADGFAGTAVAFGATTGEAMTQWRAELWRHKPGSAETPRALEPTTPAPPSGPTPDADDNVRRLDRDVQRISLGTFSVGFGAPASSVPLPALVPDNTPAARVDLDRAPPSIPARWSAAGFDRWVCVLGSSGTIGWVLAREHPDRLVLVGEGVLDIVDPETLDGSIDDLLAEQLAELRASIADAPEFLPSIEGPRFSRFRVWDGAKQRPCFRFAGSSGAERMPYESVDGDELRWCVACWSRRPG